MPLAIRRGNKANRNSRDLRALAAAVLSAIIVAVLMFVVTGNRDFESGECCIGGCYDVTATYFGFPLTQRGQHESPHSNIYDLRSSDDVSYTAFLDNDALPTSSDSFAVLGTVANIAIFWIVLFAASEAVVRFWRSS